MDDSDIVPTGPEHDKAAAAVHDVGAGLAVLLDVRRDDEWAAGHGKGATHWELVKLQAGELPDIPKDAKIYVHCAAGIRAQTAKEILIQSGWGDVANIGGLKDWEAAGGALE